MVIVGGGMAGARLARTLGARAPEALAVTVVADEPHPAYNRVLLAEVVAGRYPAEVTALPPAGPAVAWRGGLRATRLDRERRLVHCADGSELPYDVLVLATGSAPVTLPAPGGAGQPPEGVRPLRTLDDARALAAAARPGLPAVVVGGGPLGVSAAGALAERGARVVLAERAERLMPRQLDARAAALLGERLAACGVEVRTASLVTAALSQGPAGARRVVGVQLTRRDGRRTGLPAELVVPACGVRPRAGLAEAAGLALGAGGGIAVDDRLRTGDPAVYAVGDCAEHDGRLYGSAVPAQDQADVLASVLTGGPDRYRGTRAMTRLTLLPTSDEAWDVAAFGTPHAEPGDDEVRLADATRGAYRKIVVRDDRLRGGILVGDLGSVGTLARAWQGDEPLPDTPLLHLLTDDGGL